MTTDRFEELLGRLLDDEMSQEQTSELVSLCKDDAEKLRELRAHLEMSERLLQYEMDNRSSSRFTQSLKNRIKTSADNGDFLRRFTLHAKKTRQGATTHPRSWWSETRGLLAAGIAAAFLIAVLPYLSSPETPETDDSSKPAEAEDRGVAVVMQSIGVKGSSAGKLGVGASLPPGLLAFDEGLIQIEFYSGANAIVEGPASLEIRSPLELVCHSGKLRANIPELAEGFTVKAPDVDVVDRGTEFAIEVNASGETEVHVIDGLVELFPVDDASMPRQQLTTGQSISVSRGKSRRIANRETEFAGAKQLEAVLQDQRRESRERWQKMHDSLTNDPRVVARFSFQPNESHSRQLVGYSGDGTELRGAIVGCQWTEGRWLGKSALEFKRPGDRVRVELPGKYESLTYATWIRVDGLDRRFSSLLLTDNWGPNRPHWQLHASGALLLGVKYSDGTDDLAYNYRTTPLIDVFQIGRWVHLVTVYDGAKKEVLHYVNGQLSKKQPTRRKATGLMSIGKATIGNWVDPKADSSCKVRNLNGRMDELILFGVALDAAEIQQMFQSGQP